MTSESHPFKDGTQLFRVFAILADQQWHCGKHELPGTQPAKTIQIIRQNGYDIENKYIYCEICQGRIVHRRLKSLTPIRDSFVRVQLPQRLRLRILSYYKNKEAIFMRKLQPAQLEVDHRFPQVRWSTDEFLDIDMSDEEIGRRFQLLTKENNLLKSRYCEVCKATDKRGTFIGINFFAAGGALWDPNIASDDERGCRGCFWYDPSAWRDALNAQINQNCED